MEFCYYGGYAPPKWVSIQFMPNQVMYNGLASKSVLYHSKADNHKKELIKKLAIQREPVNIAQSRFYDQNFLQDHFGWRQGAYKIQKDGSLPPNFAIYCHTPVVDEGELTMKPPIRFAHVINAIGYAFDDESQPDYQYFFNKSTLNLQLLVNAYVHTWKLCFAAASELNKTLVVCGLGAGAFNPYKLPGNKVDVAKFLERVHYPAVMKAHESYPHVKFLDGAKTKYTIPNYILNKSQEHIDSLLFVNAWDPFSMPGNGNEGDDSLDGYWGRSSAIAALSWPLSNPHLKYKAV